MTQPALRESLNRLEEELQFKIFNRSNLGMTPTENGKQFLQEVEYIIQIISHWDRFVENETSFQGTVELSIVQGIYDNIACLLATRASRQYPNMRLKLYKKNAADILKEFINRKKMMAITVFSKDQLKEIKPLIENCNLKMEYLYQDSLVFAIASKIHGNNIVSPELLKNFHTVVRSPREYSKAQLNEFNNILNKYLDSYSTIYLDSNEAILRLLSEGETVSLMMMSMIKSQPLYKKGEVSIIEIPDLLSVNYIVLIYPYQQLSALEMRVIQLLKDCVKYNQTSDV